MKGTLSTIILIWLLILSFWPEVAGRQAHSTWKAIVAGWEQVDP